MYFIKKQQKGNFRGDYMFAYALVGYLDNETEKNFKRLWTNLSEKNITHYGIENRGRRPHITIADYEILDKNIFIELLEKFYEEKQKVDISLNILGTFINTGTLFIAPTLSTELLTFHNNHHKYFKEFNENENSFYLPGKWIPHCTIASRLDEDKMIQAFRYCKSNIGKTNCMLDEIALIEIKLNDTGVAIDDNIIFSKKLK